jgi:YD repeat-containing protein
MSGVAAADAVDDSIDEAQAHHGVEDPKKVASADPDDYTTRTSYDLNHRVTEVEDAAGNTTSRTYDLDSLVTSTTDAEGNTTEVSYDERGLTTSVTMPHDTGVDRTTRYEYDEVGNRTKVLSPRAVEAGSDTAFVSETVYDELNRPIEHIQPYDPNDARYHTPVKTITTYDAVGRVAKSSLPPSEGQPVRNDTEYEYFDNGWIESSTDPWDIVTSYDYNELGQQTARTFTSAGGSTSRTMGWGYYPDGKLASRSDDGVPVGSHVVLVDNSDTQHVTSAGTWTTADADGQHGYDHTTHAAGDGEDTFTWTLNIPADGSYEVFVTYPEVPGAATAAPYTVTDSSGTTDTTLDQSTGSDTWTSLGSFAFTQGNDAKLELAQDAGGIVIADAVKLVRDTSGETDTEAKDFTYTYDANGNLTEITDASSTAEVDTYRMTYTGLNQVDQVEELASGQTTATTSYTYDAAGQVLTQTHPDQHSAYTYELRELVETVEVADSPTDPDPKTTSFTYTPRGQKLQETKANGNTVDYTYYLDGRIKTQAEKKPGGTLVSEHTISWDANGNKSQDIAKKMNADDTSAYLTSTTTYTYDPVDRIAEVTKTGNGAGTETYVHDDNANVISQTVKGVASTYTYDRNRLLASTTSGTTFSYTYDPFGRQESITGGGEVIERTTYDGFDHVTETTKLNETGGTDTTTYTYDPLDRTASKTVDGETTEFNYLGTSSEVLNEEAAGEVTKSYQYSPWGQRLSQIKHDTTAGTEELGTYGYNTRGDVETVTTDNGDTLATYGYTAYGSDVEEEFTGIDAPDTGGTEEEPYNVYRFNAKRWDVTSESYDMGFRNYSPGLNRFTTGTCTTAPSPT